MIAPNELVTLLDLRHVRAAPTSQYVTLTAKEREVLHAVAQGLSNSELSQRIFLSESTIKTHVGSILRKLRLRDRVQIVVYAYEHDLS